MIAQFDLYKIINSRLLARIGLGLLRKTKMLQSDITRAWKNVNFPGSSSQFPVGRKLKTIAPLWRRKRNLFSWKRCTQEP